MQCTVCDVQCPVYVLQCVMCRIQCAMYSVQCAVSRVQCAMYSVQCGVSRVQFAVYSVQCIVCSIQGSRPCRDCDLCTSAAPISVTEGSCLKTTGKSHVAEGTFWQRALIQMEIFSEKEVFLISYLLEERRKDFTFNTL